LRSSAWSAAIWAASSCPSPSQSSSCAGAARAMAEARALRDRIASSRKTVQSTPQVEQEVIILREISDRIREILPDTKDLNNVIRDFEEYMQEAGVTSQGFRPTSNSNSRQRTRSAFERVSYQWRLAGDTFQVLDFLNRIETHSRFMAVSKLSIKSANRRAILDEGVASHTIILDVETYKYVQPSAETTGVEINGYERKRDLLAGEIARRRDALTTLETYRYRGPRGRRDPLIDPRVPAQVDDPNAWTVQRQMEEVDQLVARMAEARRYWEASNSAASVLERMVQRSELEKVITLLDEDIRRIERENRISYNHDGSNTQEDSFEFAVSDGTNPDFTVELDGRVVTTTAPQVGKGSRCQRLPRSRAKICLL